MESTNNWKLKDFGLVVALLVLLPLLLFVGSRFINNESDDLLLQIVERHQESNKPLKTNSWFSTLYDFPSEPVFAYPAAYKVDRTGVGISLPQVTATENTVFAPYVENCLLEFEDPITTTSVADYGDWHVLVDLETAGNNGTLSMIQGSPYLYLSYSGSSVISCVGYDVDQIDDDVVVFSSDEQGAFIVQSDELNIENSVVNVTDDIRIGVLPNVDSEVIARFRNETWLDLPRTVATWSVSETDVNTSFEFPHVDFLTTIWPHHKLSLNTQVESLATYNTVLGEMDLVSVSSLSFTNERNILDGKYLSVNDEEHKSEIRNQVNDDIDRFSQLNFPEGVYSRGVQLGALSSLVELTATYEPDRLEEIVDTLEDSLVPYLSSFKYDPQKKMLTALHSEFGNKEGNDHHFHYGYYIRAASTLVKYRPNLKTEIERAVNEMVSDIASSEDNDYYPKLRNHSIYEGHSWADGLGDFADGNNQESTSEALNAWYAIYLWGTVVEEPEVEELGAWLFSQELLGAKAYWWGVNNSFPVGYSHEIASLVWGGKRDFSTWFSADPLHIYGIQILPITPASIYLSEIARANYNSEIRNLTSDPFSHEWGDLYATYVSYSNSDEAIAALPLIESFEGMKIRSLLLHTVYKNREL